MPFTVTDLQTAASDEALLGMLQANLNFVFPGELRRDPAVFLPQLRTAPKGLRAMAATFELDISMALDDLAWHFKNNPDVNLYEETCLGLRELGANEPANILEQAFSIIRPYLFELKKISADGDAKTVHAWLKTKGIQSQIDPLNKRLWDLFLQSPKGILHYWTAYARKHPEHCGL